MLRRGLKTCGNILLLAMQRASQEGVFCGMRIAKSCQGVICRKIDADFFCGMNDKVRNESMRNVTEMNIY